MRGGQVTIRCAAAAGSFALVAVSEGVRPPIPLPPGDLWIDPASFFVLAVTSVPESIEVPMGVPSYLRIGAILTMQAAVLLPDGTLVLTMPSFPFVGI